MIDNTNNLPFSFEKYSASELSRIGAAVQDLAKKPAEASLEDCGIGLPLQESWMRGTLQDVLKSIDDATLGTVEIGKRFVSKAHDDPARMAKYYWRVENSQPGVKYALLIGLVLVSTDAAFGNIVLGQEVLRLDEDEYVHWGVD